MPTSTGDNTKRKRPPQTGAFIGVRVQPTQLAAIDAWIAEQAAGVTGVRLTRPEAIRRLTADALITMGLLGLEQSK